MQQTLALLAATLPLAKGQAQLLPCGQFKARDGRPGDALSWSIDDDGGHALAAHVNAIAAQTPIVIDYEHQTLAARHNGRPAPASGWVQSAEWRDGHGLFATVEWTPRARGFIDGGEYRYVSPLIAYDKASGRVVSVLNAALVNYPALLGMEPVIAQLAACLGQETASMDSPLLPALVAALHLPPETTEETALTAVAALTARPPLPAAVCAALGLQDGGGEASALSAIAALKAAVAEREVNELVDQAITDYKLVPALRDWALGLGKSNLASLKVYLASAQVFEALQGQTGGVERAADADPHEVARRAQKFQDDELAAGRRVSTAQAVAAVTQTQ